MKNSSTDLMWGELKSGFIDTLNEQQANSLNTLKEIMLASEYSKDVKGMPDLDRYLLRYLRANMKSKNKHRIFDIEAAKKGLISTLEMRRKHKIDEYRDSGTNPEGFDKYEEVNPAFAYKDSRAKLVVGIQRFGLLGTYTKMSHFTEEEWELYLLHQSELRGKMRRELLEETGVEAPVIVSRYDVSYIELSALFTKIELISYTPIKPGDFNIICEKGLGMGFLGNLKLIKMIARIAGDHSPEAIYQVHIVNAPWIFAKLFAVVKPFIDNDTKTKIHVYSNVPVEFFRENLDPSLLPKEYGGDLELDVPIPLDARNEET